MKKKEPIPLYAICCLFLIKPYAIVAISPAIETIYNLGFLFSTVCCVLLSVCKRYWPSFANYGLLFYGIIYVSTVIYGGDYITLTKMVLGMLSFVILVGYSIERKNGEFLRVGGTIFCAYVLLNSISIILFPKGLSMYSTEYTYAEMYFLGHPNGIIKYAIPALCFQGTYDLVIHGKLKLLSIATFVATVISVVLTQSATGIVAILVFILMYFLCGKKSTVFRRICNCYVAIGVNLGFFLLIILLRMQEKFSYLISETLGRDLTFTGRTRLWDALLQYIGETPILGHGMPYSSQITSILSYSNVSAHNLMMDFLYRGGISCIVVLMILLVVIQKRINQIDISISFRGFWQCGLLACSIGWLTDTYIGDFFALTWAILCVGFYLKFIDKKKEIIRANRKQVRIKIGRYILGRG